MIDELVMRTEDWPHGLRCAECERKLVDGDRYSQRLESFMDDSPVLLIVCLACNTPDEDEEQ